MPSLSGSRSNSSSVTGRAFGMRSLRTSSLIIVPSGFRLLLAKRIPSERSFPGPHDFGKRRHVRLYPIAMDQKRYAEVLYA